jgi:hypothetical protein
MAMQQRERILALALGVAVALIVVYWGFGRYRSMFTTREALIKNRTDEVTKSETKLAKIKRDNDRRKELEKRSLPKDLYEAERLYQEWLVSIASKLAGNTVDVRDVRVRSKGYQALGFRVTGEGNLEQVTQVLYDFYSANHLHQITRLNIDPQEKTKLLKLDMDVDALILPGVKRSNTLTDEPGDNLVLEGFDKYKSAIVGRNLFAEYTPPVRDLGPPAPPPQNLDKARLAFITSIMENNGRPEAWLTERLENNKRTTLYEGSEFEVAGLKGTVKRIDFEGRFVELEIDGKPVTVTQSKSLGDTLAEAKKGN